MADFWQDFDDARYGGTELAAPGEKMLANKGLVISFHHIPSDNTVYFKAFMTAYNETFNSEWSSETVYGRSDPIYLFKNTQRKITIAFKVPAVNTDEAFQNLGKIQLLTQFLYPTYQDGALAQTITQSPLVRMKLMNMASNTAGAAGGSTPSSYGTSGAGSDGLLGVINNVTFNHNLDTDVGVIEIGQGIILPKLIEVNIDFSPIHEHALGWDAEGKFGTGTSINASGQKVTDSNGSTFPYGIGATVPTGTAVATSPEAADDQAPAPTDDATDADAELPVSDAVAEPPAATPVETPAVEAAKDVATTSASADVAEAAKAMGSGGTPPESAPAEVKASEEKNVGQCVMLDQSFAGDEESSSAEGGITEDFPDEYLTSEGEYSDEECDPDNPDICWSTQ